MSAMSEITCDKLSICTGNDGGNKVDIKATSSISISSEKSPVKAGSHLSVENARGPFKKLLSFFTSRQQRQPAPPSFLTAQLPNFDMSTDPTGNTETISSPKPDASTPCEPVFNPTTGKINAVALQNFVENLKNALPKLTGAAGAQAAQAAQSTTLAATLQQVPALLDGKNLNDNTPAHTMGKSGEEIRDVFAQAAKDAGSVCTDRRMRKLVSAFFVELKRIHLTGAAHFVIDTAAEMRVRAVMPETERKRPGTNATEMLGVNAGVNLGPIRLGASVTKAALAFVDEGTPIDDLNGININLSAKANVGVGTVTAGVGILTGKTLIEANDAFTAAKWQINQEANRSSSVRSASPATRAALKETQQTTSVAGIIMLGNRTGKPPTPTYLNKKKLMKGADTRQLEQLAQEIDKRAPGSNLAELVRAAYPSMEARIAQHGSKAFNPLTAAIAMPYGQRLRSKWLSFMLPTVSLKFSLPPIVASIAGMFKPGFNPFSTGINYTLLDFHIELKMATHEMFSAAWRKDMQQPLWMHARDERLFDGDWKPEYAVFHLYKAVRTALGGEKPETGNEKSALGKETTHFYGDEAEIPAQFLDTIHNPSPEKIRRIANVCTSLNTTYARFAGHASVFLSKPALPLKDTLKAEQKKVFEAIHRDIWGGNYPGGYESAMKNPNKFIYLSYDAISKALACAGSHLSIAKRQAYLRYLEEEWTDEAQIKKDYTKCIRDAERAYKDCADLMDGIHFPAPKPDVLNKTMLVEKAEFRRHNSSATVGTGGGVGVDLLANLEGGTAGEFQITNQAAAGSISVQFQVQHADQQINASRLGTYFQFDVTATADAGLGILLPLAAKKIVAKLYDIVDDEDPARKALDTSMDREKLATMLVQGMQNPLLNMTKGATAQMKMRRDPNSGAFKLEFRRAYVNQSSGFDVSFPVNTPIGQVTLGATKLSSVQENVVQINGECLCIQILLTPSLIALVDEVKREQGDDKDLAARILKHGHMKTGFFGSPSVIANIVDYFDLTKRQAENPESDQSADGKKPSQNEFYRYFHEEPFKRIAQVANEAVHFAPGMLSDQDDPFAPPPLPLNAVMGLPEDLRDKWDAIKSDIAKLKNAKEAVDYYCCDPDGRKVFDAYIDIMRATSGINSAGFANVKKHSHGFVVEYRKEKLNKRAARPSASMPDDAESKDDTSSANSSVAPSISLPMNVTTPVPSTPQILALSHDTDELHNWPVEDWVGQILNKLQNNNQT
jgi:hypothetical protein